MQYIRELKKYHLAHNPEDAVRMISQEPGSILIAGGTELIVSKRYTNSMTNLVDITRAGLSYIKKEKKSIKIGSTSTISEIQHNPTIMDFANSVLTKAAQKFVSVQIRNVATIGGNIASGWPSSDLMPVLMVLNAKFHALGKDKKEFLADSFVISKGKTLLGSNEMLTEIEIPVPAPEQKIGFSFLKFGRTETDIAVVNGACALELDEKQHVKSVRLALGSVSDKVIRCAEVENELTGKALSAEIIKAACEHVSKSIDPKSDVRASAKYRGTIAKVLAARLITEAYNNAGGKL
ncbi:MAG: FAD binding domain-containing protein [Candidatus Wallbacteria bacterium]